MNPEEIQDNTPQDAAEEIPAEPNFMDLGAPKHNRNYHIDKLTEGAHPTGIYHTSPDVTSEPQRRIFRISIEPHTRTQYILWAIAAIIIGIAVVSFITESTLLVIDKLKGTSNIAMAENPDQQGSTTKSNQVASTAAAIAIANQVKSGTANGSTSLASQIKEYSIAAGAKAPILSSKAYLVGDIDTGEIIYSKDQDTAYPLASVSKLMTALVAYENMDLNKFATVSRDSYNTFGAEGNLVLGDKLKIADLMYPLLMESSNDGAEVIADDYGHREFLELMNKTAVRLGMTTTYYEDPSGLNPKNTSTPADQFKLAQYIVEHAPTIFDKTRIKVYQVGAHRWTNQNAFLKYSYFLGGKNGFIDEAKLTTVSLFDVPLLKGGTRTLAVVVLKSGDKEGDAIKLVNFMKKYGVYTPYEITLEKEGIASTSSASTSLPKQ